MINYSSEIITSSRDLFEAAARNYRSSEGQMMLFETCILFFYSKNIDNSFLTHFSELLSQFYSSDGFRRISPKCYRNLHFRIASRQILWRNASKQKFIYFQNQRNGEIRLGVYTRLFLMFFVRIAFSKFCGISNQKNWPIICALFCPFQALVCSHWNKNGHIHNTLHIHNTYITHNTSHT